MKGLPFNFEMARAWHVGRKTTHRVLMKPQPFHYGDIDQFKAQFDVMNAPYQPGEIVYVQEPWVRYQPILSIKKPDGRFIEEVSDGCVAYEVDGYGTIPELKNHARLVWDFEIVIENDTWRFPGTMPEWASRSWARIVDVRPEQVQEITEDEASREGIVYFPGSYELKWFTPYMRDRQRILDFRQLWDSLHPGSWERNDWVWRYGLGRM